MENLPLILISARNESSAAVLITELIDNKSIIKDESSGNATVLKFVNKYYTANVKVHSLIDGNQLDPGLRDLVEAHIIYLAADEVDEKQLLSLVEQRCSVTKVCPGLNVRLMVVEGKETNQLLAVAITSNVELVSLHQPADDEEDGEWGTGRVREALQAHVWSSAQLLRSHLTPRCEIGSDGDDSSDESWSSWQAAEREGGVDGSGEEGEECGEEFAGALRSLAGAAAAARALHEERDGETEEERWAASRAERLACAEALVFAFCQALEPSTR